MNSFYSVVYKDDPNGLTLVGIEPPSDYVEEMFYNGQLLREVHLGDCGKFMLDIWLEEDGSFKIEGKFKYRGWCEVEI